MSKLVCENLTKAYGQKTVLENLNLTLESGKIYGLIGRNGAGKTTLLSLMTSQTPVTSGRVTLDGQRIWDTRKSLDRLCFSREQFYQLLLEEYTETGRTFVISTHIIEEAADVMEEVIILDKGKIIREQNTQELVDSARYVTGLADQVDGATAGLECHHSENLGRSKSVTVLLGEDEDLNPGYDVTVQPVNLQKVFVALCGEEARV